MIKKFIKLLALLSLAAVIISPAETIEIVADSDTQSLFQTMSHGIGGT
jgi:hypothetical protein